MCRYTVKNRDRENSGILPRQRMDATGCKHPVGKHCLVRP